MRIRGSIGIPVIQGEVRRRECSRFALPDGGSFELHFAACRCLPLRYILRLGTALRGQYQAKCDWHGHGH